MNFNKVGNIINNNPLPKKDFTQISNKLIFSTLDPFEKLILQYLLAVPPVAQINQETIQEFTGIGNYGVRKACKSLQESGILTINKIPNGNGYFKYEYIINDFTEIIDSKFNRCMISTNGTTTHRSTISYTGEDTNRCTISYASYKDNTIKDKDLNKTNKTIDIEESNKNTTLTTTSERQSIVKEIQDLLLSKEYEFLNLNLSTIDTLIRNVINKKSGIENLKLNLEFAKENSFLNNLTARLIHSVKSDDVYLLTLNQKDLEDKERIKKEYQDRFKDKNFIDLREAEQYKIQKPNLSYYYNFFRSINSYANNLDSVRISFTRLIFESFLYKEYKDIQIDKNVKNNLIELIYKVSINNLTNIIEDVMTKKQYINEIYSYSDLLEFSEIYQKDSIVILENISNNLSKLR